MADGRTIVFFPEGAFGPTNNCVGIGDILRRRGHRVVFIVEESFAGNLEAKGFEERLMRLGPAPTDPEVPGQFWIDFIRDTAPVFRKPTIEQLGEFIAPTFQALTTLSSTMASGWSSSMISVRRGSTYFAPSMSACQVGAMKPASCSSVLWRKTGAVSRTKSFQN